jgi:peptidoglycan hydrolase-like protein with peptidoglycan-binding domain
VTGIAVPRIVGFRTRQQLGLVAPRSVSHQIDADPGGVAVHYGGDPAPVKDHAACESRWRAWQAMHMAAPRGWNDIAYTGGYCSHGYAFAGRGLGVRTAGQGTNDGNDRYYAVCWVNDRATPTPEALSALSWWVVQARAGGAGLDVRAHRTFHSTSCPGDPLAAYAALLDGKAVPTGSVVVVVSKRKAAVLGTQRAVHVTADGQWGPNTDAAVGWVRELRDGKGTPAQVRAAQHAVGVTADGAWGALSRAAHKRTVRGLQGAWRSLTPGLGVDGVWGSQTDKAYGIVRAQVNGKRV